MMSMLRYIPVVIALMISLDGMAGEERDDTVYFYSSWQKMLYLEPDTMIVDAMIDFYSPFELYFETSDKQVSKRIKKDYIAATLGDSTWLVNSNYLKEYFKGDSKRLHGYVPLFFNEKVAYAVAEEYMYAEVRDMAFNVISTYNYYIDFKQRKVCRAGSEMLRNLLADYPDLRMRYESMRDNERSSIMNDFFDQFVERATDDLLRPYILDLVGDDKQDND